VMVRWLCQIGLDAKAFDTEFGDEDEEVTDVTSSKATGSAAPEEGEKETKDA